MIFFPVYWLVRYPIFRKYWLLFGCATFYYKFAGSAGVIPILILGVATYFAGIISSKLFKIVVITLCVLELAFYKYSNFLISQALIFIDPNVAQTLLQKAKDSILPGAAPLAISFFVFEFVHYLVDVYRGKPPIRSVSDFSLFSMFWPSVVSGPIKRFEQFIPALASGCKRVSLLDIQVGTMRIVMGLFKKLVIADNLTGYIDFWHPLYNTMSLEKRWIFLFAISLRILFDFSGYSDIAIGFARLMGIKLPENFRWPYLATNIQDFWRRWHISLSSWIRDYIYIPLGGNKYGSLRKLSNGIFAFAVCGLWHGAAWNFVIWGLYHGVGLAITTNLKPFFPQLKIHHVIVTSVNWLMTFLFVSVGWLYFFYPVTEATKMFLMLFKKSY